MQKNTLRWLPYIFFLLIITLSPVTGSAQSVTCADEGMSSNGTSPLNIGAGVFSPLTQYSPQGPYYTPLGQKSTDTQSVFLWCVGSEPVTAIGAPKLVGSSDFSITGENCGPGTFSKPGYCCRVQVSFSPSILGYESAAIYQMEKPVGMRCADIAGWGGLVFSISNSQSVYQNGIHMETVQVDLQSIGGQLSGSFQLAALGPNLEVLSHSPSYLLSSLLNSSVEASVTIPAGADILAIIVPSGTISGSSLPNVISTGASGVGYLSNSLPLDGHLEVASAHIWQVFKDPQLGSDIGTKTIDIVEGKSTSLSLKIIGGNLDAASGSIAVDVLASGQPVASSPSIPISTLRAALKSQGFYKIDAKSMGSIIPQGTGDYPLTVQIDTSSAQGVVSHQPYNDLHVKVIKTYAPTVGLVPFGDCDSVTECYTPVSQANITKFLQAGPALSDVFPVADGALHLSQLATFHGHPGSADSPLVILADTQSLEIEKILNGLNRIVAIVPDKYFQYVNIDSTGDELGHTFEDISFVGESAYIATAAHELFHTFGVTDMYANGLYTGPNIEGYDARTMFKYQDAAAIMGPGNPGSSSLWPPTVWPYEANYNFIFEQLESQPVDPKILVVSGIIGKDGKILMGPAYSGKAGYLTQTTSGGTVTVNLLNSSREIVSSIGVKFDTTLQIDDSSSPLQFDMGAMPFAIALPDLSSAAYLQITKDGTTLKTAALNGMELLGLIKGIPLSGYRVPKPVLASDLRLRIARHEQHRLLMKVAKIQRMINSNKSWAAKELLFSLIKEIKKLTNDDYTIQDPTEFTKAEVIAKIESIAASLPSKPPHEIDGNKKQNDHDSNERRHK